MSQSLTQIYLHIVFTMKLREPYLRDKPFQARVHAYPAGICNRLDSPCLQAGGAADHVHILCRLAKTIAVADLTGCQVFAAIQPSSQPEASLGAQKACRTTSDPTSCVGAQRALGPSRV